MFHPVFSGRGINGVVFMIKKLEYTDNHELLILDQTLLPEKEKYLKLKNYRDVIDAIMNLKVRGAPLTGIAAAYGIVLGFHNFRSGNKKNLEIHFDNLIESFRSSRPTAKNLFFALTRMDFVFQSNLDKDLAEIENRLVEEADSIYNEDVELCSKIGQNGSELLADGMRILTHCNTGELAAGGIGTAQGIITTAARQAKNLFVYVSETRPLLQGSRLTAYELSGNNVDFELIVDSAAADLMRDRMVDCVIVGADRIASNGDVANKIGSYSLAVNCAYHKIPFYVAAPGTTIDFELESGESIAIEERSPDELRWLGNVRIAPADAKVWNPAFDLVPNNLVSAIITEYRIHYPPYDFRKIRHMFSGYVQSITL
jgi:methylthioribose-1-phosphate isomerase